MKLPIDLLTAALEQVLGELRAEGLVGDDTVVSFSVDPPRQAEHGDFSTNLAMVLARPARRSPRSLAEDIVNRLGTAQGLIERAEIAGPGFINFHIAPTAIRGVLAALLTERETFLRTARQQEKILVEFVSANPTGPLHVGHSRGAVTGDTLVRMLRRVGHKVTAEYYVNDAGRQIEILGQSVLYRYQELCGQSPSQPEDFYPGDYIRQIAQRLHQEHGPALLERADCTMLMRDSASKQILAWIKRDLEEMGIHFNQWTSERALYQRLDIDGLMERLSAAGYIYEQNGAKWFRTTAFGDEKDRVVIREDGRPTYFASDIAYHDDKMRRGFDRLINVWGADHVGYVARVKAGLAALGHDPEVLRVVLVQMVNLLRDGEPVKMGKRSGAFVELREVRAETGTDAARFFVILRSSDAQLDFDLALATRQSMENPVYYVQYGHARICAILRQAEERGIPLPSWSESAAAALRLPEELSLCKKLSQAPEVLSSAAESLEPHRIVYYLRDLIADFHSYYTRYKGSERVISEDQETTAARLLLCLALRDLLADMLGTLGITAPERMLSVSAEETA